MKKRDATSDVFRAVVLACVGASAMLGCSSGSKSPGAETTLPEGDPAAVAPAADAAPMLAAAPDAAPPPPDAAPPDAAPVAKPRPRPSGGKPQGRGFLLV